jgi:hypothetical protein
VNSKRATLVKAERIQRRFYSDTTEVGIGEIAKSY